MPKPAGADLRALSCELDGSHMQRPCFRLGSCCTPAKVKPQRILRGGLMQDLAEEEPGAFVLWIVEELRR